jgi:hypothetical protein
LKPKGSLEEVVRFSMALTVSSSGELSINT